MVFYRQGQDLETASISSNGSGFIDELYIPPDTDAVDVDEKPQPVGGTYQYHVKNENGSYTKLLSFDKDGLDMNNKPISNVSSGQNEDTNAANIGDVKRLISNEPDGGLLPTNNQWDMLSYPLINAGSVGFNEHISSSGSGASYARFTTGSLELGAQGQVYFVADGAAVSNLGAFGFASTDGVGADRGVYGAVAAMDVATFSGTRTADPVPHNDVAVVADAKYAPVGSKALYAYGDVILEGGSVTVPSASADTDAVNLGDIKGKERIFEFDLSDGVAKTITVSGINLDNAIVQTTDDNENVEVKVVRDSVNSQVVVTATGGNLTDVRMFIQELSCAVTQA